MTEKSDEEYTKFEKARILGARALQISSNAPILLKLDKKVLEELNFDPIKIAEMEFNAKILPITVKRPLPKKIEKEEGEFVEIIDESIEESKKQETGDFEKDEEAKEEPKEKKVEKELEEETKEVISEFEKEESSEEITEGFEE